MVLPNFLICGAPKCGTTALYEYLKQHPDVFMSRPKETFFFSDEFDRGVEWFAEHFSAHDGEKAIGEASTTTMYAPEAPSRIQDVLGTPKLLFVLRNPIERAYSEYLFFVHKGRIPANISFSDVVFQGKSTHSERILEMGKYDQFLSPFVEEFGRKRVKIIIHSEFRENTASTLKALFQFLELDEEFRIDALEEHNVTRSSTSPILYYWIRRLWHAVRAPVEKHFPVATRAARQMMRGVLFSEGKPPMDEEVRSTLREFYGEQTFRLEERLERDLSHWR